MCLPERDHALEEPEQAAVLFKQTPVDPGDFIVLIVWIGLPLLGSHELVACH